MTAHDRPTYSEYVTRLHGDAGPLRVVGRAFAAGSLAEFWRLWNPGYGYALRYFVHAPLRRVLPAPLARGLTFVFCGFMLHDLPFLYAPALVRGSAWPLPFTTILFVAFGLQAELVTALGVSWSGRALPVRVAANLAALGVAALAAVTVVLLA